MGNVHNRPNDLRHGPVITEGFEHVWLQTLDIAKLGVALPLAPGEPRLLTFPLALPKG